MHQWSLGFRMGFAEDGSFVALLRTHSERWELDILGYGLMGNHVHVIAVPQRENSLAKALGRTHYN